MEKRKIKWIEKEEKMNRKSKWNNKERKALAMLLTKRLSLR